MYHRSFVGLAWSWFTFRGLREHTYPECFVSSISFWMSVLFSHGSVICALTITNFPSKNRIYCSFGWFSQPVSWTARMGTTFQNSIHLSYFPARSVSWNKCICFILHPHSLEAQCQRTANSNFWKAPAELKISLKMKNVTPLDKNVNKVKWKKISHD